MEVLKPFLSLAIMAVLVISCGQIGETAKIDPTEEQEVELSEDAAKATQERIDEMDENFRALWTELNRSDLKAEEEIVKAFEDIQEKKEKVDELVGQYNESLIAGEPREAEDLREEINRRVEEIQEDINVLRERREKTIEGL